MDQRVSTLEADVAGATAPIRISGKVKWFDSNRGFGFIAPEDGSADVLLHKTCLKSSGFQTICEGARVVCDALPGPHGLKAQRILSADHSEYTDGSKAPALHTPELVFAKVIKFDPSQGFGFLMLATGKDVFVHQSTLERCGIPSLVEGEFVSVCYEERPKGLRATKVVVEV